ncbi:C40 family peptidase [Taibaiella soli]|uniref:Uncharacterized protein n=1 Tax=Taibaiella soli TaxID=1649169 RepID=A0A2W2BD34_9BACT|nr:YiiX/YebB-like N1pC/P60 family cysteine hydrolase [Taibaiella soli]PZF73767.1 hypothetical protein DN068_05340 [Taibaiella soli]
MESISKDKDSKLDIVFALFTFLVSMAFITGCQKAGDNTQSAAIQHINHDQARADKSENRQLADSAVKMLHTGDIVMRTGNDVTSYMLSQINQKDKTYSHCGLVIIENGYPFVYHSIGGEDNPDERMRRDSANMFIAPYHNLGFGIARFNFSDSAVINLQKIVSEFYKRRPLFDMDFDLKTEDKLYCAEFIYKAITRATADPDYIKTTSVVGYHFVGIDDLFLSEHAKTIWQVRYK